MSYGEPIHVPPKIGRDELADYVRMVQQAVEDLNEHAVELTGVPMPTVPPGHTVGDPEADDESLAEAA